MLESEVIFWSSKRKPAVALSSTKVEYRDAIIATCEAIWPKRLLKDLKEPIHNPIQVYFDKLSTIQLAQNPVFHACTKHTYVHYHFISKRIVAGKIDLQYVHMDFQTTSQFTHVFTFKKHSSTTFTIVSVSIFDVPLLLALIEK